MKNRTYSKENKSPSWWSRIKFKLLFFGIIMSIAPIFLVGTYNIQTTKISLEESIKSRQISVVQRAASEVDNLLSSIKGRMELVANTNNMLELNTRDKENWEQNLYGFLKQNTEIENAYVFNSEGKIIASAQRWDVKTPLTITDRQYERIKSKSNLDDKCLVGDVGFKKDGSPYVNMGMPFYLQDGRTFNGGLIIEVSLRGTFKKVSSFSSGKDGYIYILDGENRLIAHTDFSKVLLGKNVIHSPKLMEIVKNRDYITEPIQYDNDKGDQVIGAYAPIKTTNWGVVVEQPIKKAYAPISILVQRLILIMVLAIALVVLISVIFGIWFTKPVELIGKAVEKVRSGNLDTKINYQSSDEFGKLSLAFNHMTEELKLKSEHLLQEKERLDTIINGSGSGFALVYEDYRIGWMNQRLEKWLSNEGDGQLCYNLLGRTESPCDDCPILQKNLEQCQNEVTTTIDQKGKKRIYSHRMYPLEYVREGEPQYLIVVEDITEQKQLEEMVEQADKLSALGILASGFAHEVNNPLASISAYAEDLKERYKEEPIEELIDSGDMDHYLDIIQNNVERCKVITNNLLNFSRKPTFTSSETDLVKIIRDSISLLQHSFKKKKITVNNHIEAIPLVYADGLQVQQVIVNLLQNAIDASDEDGNIELYSKQEENQIEIHIKDDGNGMTPDEVSKAFDPFYTTKPVGKGTGLGLYISYNMIKKMNGNIVINSKKGLGSDITVILPTKKA